MSKKKSNNQQSSNSASNPSAPSSTLPSKTPSSRSREHSLTQKHTSRGTSAQPGASDTAPTGKHPTTDEIGRLAYSYWEARNGQGGSPEEDWFRAERELLGRPSDR